MNAEFLWNWWSVKNVFYDARSKKQLLTVSAPGFHPAGHTSPCLSVYFKACTSRKVSSTDRPTGKSLTVICRRVPLSSMINRPLKTETFTLLTYHGFKTIFGGQTERKFREFGLKLNTRKILILIFFKTFLQEFCEENLKGKIRQS